MNSEEWQQIEELLDAALEITPAARQKFLNEQTTGAPELRREVESLLACEESADGFLAVPALAFAADLFDDANDAAADSRAGQTVGNYRIIREIGRGGMGAVYLAERADGEFQQQVALKVVRHSFADSDLVRRFRRERQILASLNHPNIARLLDGGVSAEGEPYLVMEYVEGARIDDHCDRCELSTRRRLELFIAVCQGVSYAHQHLIVHRDIKPSNVLVATEGVPKLLDFGIAKLLDPEYRSDEHTRTVMRAFTPDYASPEQISGGQVTTASDVYSLGVLLQDLLRGARASTNARRTPGGWMSKSFGRTVTINLPTNESHADQKIQSSNQQFPEVELRHIVAMARHEDPARRYASVAQFADDVQRYLDGLPIRAQKDSFTYRAGKFVRRNKVAVGAALLVASSLVVGSTVALSQANIAQSQANVARAERDRAERRFNDIRQLSNALLTDIAPKIERLQGSTEARESVVTQSLKYLDSLAKESADDTALQSELASAYEKVGDLQGNPTNPNRGALTDALISYEKANQIRRKLLEKNPRDPEQRRLLANNYRVLGDIRWQTNEPAESMKNSEAALNLYTELQAAQPDSTGLNIALARTNHDIGKSLSTNEKYAESITYFQKAIDLVEELRRQSPERVEVLTLLANCYRQVGNSLSWEGKQKEGEAEMAKAVAIFETLVAANPNDSALHTNLYQTYMMTSSLYEEVNDSLSNDFAFKALGLIEQAVDQDPFNLRAKQQLAKTYSRLGVTLSNVGKNNQSIFYLEKAAAILQQVAQNETKSRRFTQDLATVLIRLGDAKHKQHDLQGALKSMGHGAAILTELVNTDETDNASLRNLENASEALAQIHEDLTAQSKGEVKQFHRQAAESSYRRALDVLQQLEARNALSKLDRKSLEEMQSAIRRYERK